MLSRSPGQWVVAVALAGSLSGCAVTNTTVGEDSAINAQIGDCLAFLEEGPHGAVDVEAGSIVPCGDPEAQYRVLGMVYSKPDSYDEPDCSHFEGSVQLTMTSYSGDGGMSSGAFCMASVTPGQETGATPP